LSTRSTVLYEEPYVGEGISTYLKRQYQGRASSRLAEFTFRLSRCTDCGLVFQPFIPDDNMLVEIYSRWVADAGMKLENNFDLDDYRYLGDEVQFIIQHTGKRPAEIKVLDLGFGWGHWARMAMAYGCEVSGIELSDQRKEFGRSIGINVIDLDDLPAAEFDFVHTEQVFEHLAQPREVLERLTAALRTGGLIKLSVPDAEPALRKLEASRAFSALTAHEQMAVAPLEHINSFTRKSLVSFCSLVGLRPVRPSLLHMYNAASGVLRPKRLVRVLARPVYRHVLDRGTFMYFARS
jgi:2-polyprenyl-3-methyl-5-hydroxy-6-metoxy-1,4-benzoquinol methylase